MRMNIVKVTQIKTQPIQSGNVIVNVCTPFDLAAGLNHNYDSSI